MSTRDAIVEAADKLFYENGFDHTSFAHVAEAVGISRGNFYHHFKSKDEILEAVIDRRVSDRLAMLEQWDGVGETPQARLECFVRLLSTNREKIRRHGCPLGTLSSELAKLDHPLGPEAKRLFDLFRSWIRRQIEAFGRIEDADLLALQLLSMSQGATTLANVYPDEAILDLEIQRMLDWIADLTPKPTPQADQKEQS
ncbi:TetR/AcrR family transcriptional regulator [Erythrobacter mangrovi]|uniref:TetR/AcrR family transcriptional regulator n=1 Tax=Erythrobacter mangrovi TaxID=2739433 RepID=A0A7D4B7W7_9SPHN|nr:TetR/AcrR family transcriptional regulator [Erythrobacter mangrovi]QKG69981.1 TetR/AcrR family transcriptional regulator [Erythrobacter mangrovi]